MNDPCRNFDGFEIADIGFRLFDQINDVVSLELTAVEVNLE